VPEVVVITGASAGVGRAIVRRFAQRGCKLGLIARGRERLDAAAAEVEEAGGEALVLPTDVADADAVEAAAARAEDELGEIDIWINDAMATVFAPFLEIEPDEYRRATEVTYLGTVWGTRAALRRMKSRDRGTIVQVGSALAYRGIPLQAPYCGAKAAMKNFTESVRTELMHDGSKVRISMVQLPAHNTPQFSWGRTRMRKHPQPVPPIFEPEVAAQAVEHAAYHPRRELYVAWPVLKTVLGEKLAPRFADTYLARTGYKAQQADDKPMNGDRPDNLFEPAPGDFAAHGAFDDQAKARSLFLWANLHRGAVAAAGSAVALAGLLTRRR
jgi:NAD(P)-dependent dehydrogenase (short-subunit alcohol dehydrogenase family)